MPNRDDVVDAMRYWSVGHGVSLEDHTHPTVNCRCSTVAPIDGQIKIKFNVDTTPMMKEIELMKAKNPWYENKIDNLTPIYLTGDGSGVTFKKPKNKERKMSEFKREDFKIAEDLDGFCIYQINKGKWINKITMELNSASRDNKNLYFPSREQAEQALSEFLNETQIKLELTFIHNEEEKLGEVGDPTDIKDLRGETLYVGDTVELFDEEGDTNEECVIFKNGDDNYYVMGLCGTEYENGFSIKSSTKYAILKKQSYKDLKVGDTIDGVVVKKAESKELTIAQIEEKLGYKIKVVGND